MPHSQQFAMTIAWHARISGGQTGPDDRWKNEIADYRAVISELAAELMRVLQTDEIAAGKSSTGGDR